MGMVGGGCFVVLNYSQVVVWDRELQGLCYLIEGGFGVFWWCWKEEKLEKWSEFGDGWIDEVDLIWMVVVESGFVLM